MNIISNYISCLEAFSKKNAACSKQAAELADKLQNINDFSELRAEIEALTKTANQRDLFAENPFINQLKRWKMDLDALDLAFQNAIQTLHDHPETTESLFIDFIDALLKDERCKFHVRGLSLVKQLETADNLINVIQHLSDLEEVPAPKSPRPGTFDALVPENQAHERCLALLRKNAEFYDASNALSVNANSLLQSLLSIYKEIDHPDFFPSANPQGVCNII